MKPLKSPSRRTVRQRSQTRFRLSLPNTIAIIILLLCAIATYGLVQHAELDLSNPDRLMQSIQALGWRGVMVYIGFLVVAIVVGPIPSTPVTIAAGAVWGPIPAGLYGTVGVFVGSIAAYFIGRTLGRSAVQALMGKVMRFSHHRGEVYLGWLVFLAHLVPVMPYDLVSYGAGISGMSLPIFGISCLLGVIPCTFFLTSIGGAFTVGFPVAIALAIAFLAMLIVLPWGVKRYNWLGLRDLIHWE